MQLWALASGSSGNCFLLESEGTRMLVECGRPLGDVHRYLRHCGVAPELLSGIVLTHAHGDHCRSAADLSIRYNLPIYASLGTLGCLRLPNPALGRPVSGGQPFTVGEIEVQPFDVPHDCVEPLGFRFESQTGRACLTTDLGWVPDSARDYFRDLDLLVLEANYDPELLHSGRYPAFLKRRVGGRKGHLANEDAARAVLSCGDRAPGALWLAHLSETNNTPALAVDTFSRLFKQNGLSHVTVQAARHRKPSLHWNTLTPHQLPLL